LSGENDIDIETLRQSRWARLCAPLSEFFSQLSHFHWPEAKAEVIDCTPVQPLSVGRSRFLPYGPSQFDGWETVGGYAVTFCYSVDGRSYKGLTKSSFEVQKHDMFPIRYNPRNPEENNTLDSTNSRATLVTKLLTLLLALLILFLFIKAYVFRH
jgi:hypothetical protein